jgi:hypothetical protein
MATIGFTLTFPTQAQMQAMAGAGVTISTVTFPTVSDIQIETDDMTEGGGSRIAEGMANWGWQPTTPLW